MFQGSLVRTGCRRKLHRGVSVLSTKIDTAGGGMRQRGQRGVESVWQRSNWALEEGSSFWRVVSHNQRKGNVHMRALLLGIG